MTKSRAHSLPLSLPLCKIFVIRCISLACWCCSHAQLIDCTFGAINIFLCSTMVEDTRVVIVEGVAEVVATCFID